MRDRRQISASQGQTACGKSRAACSGLLRLTTALRVLATALVFILCGRSQADLVIVQQVDGGGQEGQITIHIKGSKTRADLPQPFSIITDSQSGDTLFLQHEKKNYSRIPGGQVKQLTEQLAKAEKSDAPPKLQALGQHENIGGHDTEIYSWNVGSIKMRLWVCKAYPDGPAIQKELDQLQRGGLSAVAAQMMPNAAELPGVRLRTEIIMGTQKITQTILSIKEENVDPSIFDPPKEYSEMELHPGDPPE